MAGVRRPLGKPAFQSQQHAQVAWSHDRDKPLRVAKKFCRELDLSVRIRQEFHMLLVAECAKNFGFAEETGPTERFGDFRYVFSPGGLLFIGVHYGCWLILLWILQLVVANRAAACVDQATCLNSATTLCGLIPGNRVGSEQTCGGVGHVD